MNGERVRVARRLGRSLLAVGAIAAVLAVLRLVAPPWSPSFGPAPPQEVILAEMLMPVVGTAGVFFGLASMWRIYKSPTKYDGALWRYRDRK